MNKKFQKGGNFMYSRANAVEYSEKWWNKRNPVFLSFENDCTNFISQCLLAGGIPMDWRKARNEGWWINVAEANWSFSWSVAHSLRWYLLKSGRGVEVKSVDDLQLGDIIFYDFDGNGLYQHSTIIAVKNSDETLVNAHTSDSYHRDYRYYDSTAYTPNCKYSFISIKSKP